MQWCLSAFAVPHKPDVGGDKENDGRLKDEGAINDNQHKEDNDLVSDEKVVLHSILPLNTILLSVVDTPRLWPACRSCLDLHL